VLEFFAFLARTLTLFHCIFKNIKILDRLGDFKNSLCKASRWFISTFRSGHKWTCKWFISTFRKWT